MMAPPTQLSGERARSTYTAMATLIVPVTWALGLVSMLSVALHDKQDPSCIGTWCQSLCSAAGIVGHLRCLLDVQKQLTTSRHSAWWLGGANWAAVAAHPWDLGLAAAMFMPQLLMLLLGAQLLARSLAGQRRTLGSAATQDTAAQASASASSRALGSRLGLLNTGAALLAVAQLLPLVCSMLGMVSAWVRLQRQFPAAQALQLLHPLTPALLGIMTVTSQADALQSLAVSIVHAVLAGILLASSRVPQLPGYLAPVQAWVALVLLNVALPAVAAWWRQSAAAGPAAPPGSATSTATAPAEAPASSDHAASPASPAALSEPVQAVQDCPTQTPSKPLHVGQDHLSAAAAYDPHMLQPSTPLPQDSSTSPSRRHYTPSPASDAEAAAAASSACEAHLQQGSHSHPEEQGAPQPATTPLLSFEEALAACVRGYAARQAAGSAAGTALYHSKLHHHVVSIKAALDDAQEGQELVQLVINHLNTAQASHAHPAAPAGSSSPQTHPASPATLGSPLMLRPVAMRGCLHLLLPVCTTPTSASAATGKQDTGCLLDSPLAAVLQQISKPRVVQKALFAGASQQTGSALGRSIQLHIQIDSSEPQLVVRRPDGMWRVGAHSSSTTSATATATSSSSPKHTVTEPSSGSSLQDRGTKCWLEPACVMVGPQHISSSSTPVGSPATAGSVSAPAGSSSMGRPCVVVRGLPSEVGSLVRVLLVQRDAVVADRLLPAAIADKQSAAVDDGGLRSVRLSLPTSGFVSGPAMVCVLAPPSSIATAGSAPAGVSPAVAALMMQQQPGQHAGGASTAPVGQLTAARMWAYLPLLLVDSGEAQQELSTLFADMCAESVSVQSVSAQGAGPQADTTQAPSSEHVGSSSSGSGSMGVKLAYAQYLQPFLWDWLYAVHGADAGSVLASVPELAAQFRGKGSSPAGMVGSLYQRAVVWRSTADSNSSASSSSMEESQKQIITSGLLELLVSRNMPAAIKQLQAAATRPQPLSPAAGQLTGSPMATAAATAASPSTQPLSPGTASRHDSCESYHPVGAAGGLSGWRPPVHCKDAATPALSLRKQALQEQEMKYVHTLEDEAAALHTHMPLQPLLLPEQQAYTGGSRAGSVAGSVGSVGSAGSGGGQGRQPTSRRASSGPTAAQAAASSAGLFSPALRRMSLDSLPLPQSSMPGASQLHPPRWSVGLPMAAYQQQHAQSQLFVPPSAMYGASGMLSTASPSSRLGALGAGEHHFGMHATPRGTPPLAPAAAGGAAAAAGAAAAQAALMQLHPSGLNLSGALSGASIPSPGMRPMHPSSSGSASNMRFAQQASPSASALHMQPQSSLGYSPSLASSASGAAFMTAEGVGVGGYGAVGSGRVPAGAVQPPPQQQQQQAGGEDASVLEGRHWAVFDTTGVEGFEHGVDTAATNLANTTRRNNTSSVTWLAIPTSQAGIGLLPAGLKTPRASRKSGALFCSSTGKLLRPSNSHHNLSSSLTPQPPPSRSSWSHARNTAESAEFLASSTTSGSIPMPPGSRQGGPRASLFHSSGDAAAAGSVGTAGSHFQSCSPEDLASPPARAGRGAGDSSRLVSGFSKPQRPGFARFTGASPRRGGMWSPGAAHLTTLPTIGSEGSWDQNALMPSPGPDGGVGLPHGCLTEQQQQQLAGMPPLSALRGGGSGGEAWEGSMTPGPSRGLRGPLAAPGSLPRLPPAAVAATPRGVVYRSQLGMLTPGFYASRTGNLVSGTNTLGGEGDTVSGVLQLLGGPDASSTLRTSNSAVSGFSSSSSSLAGTPPEGCQGLQGGFFQGGYFTPVRPPPHRGQASALLPASARPAGRPAVWATPAALASGRFLVPAGATSGSFAAVGASGAGFAGPRAGVASAGAGQQQVPDTPLLKAGRNIAGVLFSAPAPPMGHTMQPSQCRMSTPSHIQSLLPPPGSASKLKPAAALLGSAAVGGAPTTRPGTALQSADSSTPPRQSSAAAAAALLQPAPEGSSSNRQLTPQASGDTHAESASGALTSTSSIFNAQTAGSYLLSQEDMHTPVQSPRATPTGSPTSSSILSGGVASSSRSVSSPPPAPARPVPGVVLVPAVEAEELFYTEDGMLLNPEVYTHEGLYYTQEGFIPEGFEEVQGAHIYDM